jgi:K+-transporting ATPase c subunit
MKKQLVAVGVAVVVSVLLVPVAVTEVGRRTLPASANGVAVVTDTEVWKTIVTTRGVSAAS